MGEAENERAVRANIRMAQKPTRSAQKKLHKVLRSLTREAGRRIVKNQEPVPPDLNTRWAEKIEKALQADSKAAAFLGYKWAAQTFEKTLRDEIAVTPAIASVESYLQLTSRKAAQSKGRAITNLIRQISEEQVHESGQIRGLDPRAVARSMEGRSAGFDRTYSELIARTSIAWSQAEGSISRFRQIGVTQKQWYATEDERTCPFCNRMHGTIIPINNSFLGRSQPFEGTVQTPDGKLKTVRMTSAPGLPTDHPPLHPNCRCGILPVLVGGVANTEPSPPGTITPISRDVVPTELTVPVVEEIPIPIPPVPVPPPTPPPVTPTELLAISDASSEEIRADLVAKADALDEEISRDVRTFLEERKAVMEEMKALENEYLLIREHQQSEGLVPRDPPYREGGYRAADWAELERRKASIDKTRERSVERREKLRKDFFRRMKQPGSPAINFANRGTSTKSNRNAIEEFASMLSPETMEDDPSPILELLRSSTKDAPREGFRTTDVRFLTLKEYRDHEKAMRKIPGFENYDSLHRAFADSVDNTIWMQKSGAADRTAVHEFGHHMENTNKKVNAKMQRFIRRRTTLPDGTREPLRKLSEITGIDSYEEWEVTRPDQFLDEYIGKEYIWRGDGESHSSEAFSMGIEYFWADPVKFAKDDPDHFRVILDVMRGRFDD